MDRRFTARGVHVLPRFLLCTAAGTAFGLLASAVVPTLLFGGSSDDYALSVAPLVLPGMTFLFLAAPFLALNLRRDGIARFVGLCVLFAVLLIVLRDLGWASAFGLAGSPAVLWGAVFKAFVVGVPGGVVGAGTALLLLRLLPRRNGSAA